MKLIVPGLSERDEVPAVPTPSGLDIRLTMAPALYGSNVAWMFLGFILMQTYTYYHNSQRDQRLFKTFVYAAVLIEIAATGIECYIGYQYLVGKWNDPGGRVVEVPPKAFLFQPTFDAVLGTMVQCFFAWRIWTFGVVAGKRLAVLTRFITVFIVILSVLALACSIAFPILFFKVDLQPQLWTTTRPVVTAWTVSSAVIDVVISSCMIAILRHARSKTHFADTRDTLSKLIRLTVQTGTLTSVLALAIIIVFLTEPFGNMHTFPAYLLGKSYAMSLLANVNARMYAPQKGQPNATTQGSLAFSPPKMGRRRRIPQPGISSYNNFDETGMSSDDYTTNAGLSSDKDIRGIKLVTGSQDTASEGDSVKHPLPVYETQTDEIRLHEFADERV